VRSEQGVIDRRLLWLVVLLALVVAAPSISNGFAYDDEWVLLQDQRLHDLARWTEWLTSAYWHGASPALYRPLTTTLFALQWWAGDGAPWIFHAVSIVLHAAVTAAVWWLATLLTGRAVGAVVAALFAVHPVHVEAVANVVGQSELSAGLCLIGGLAYYINARQRGPLSWATTGRLALIFGAGAALKEHAFVLPALWGVAELTVLRAARPWRPLVKELAPLYTTVACIAVALLFARHGVLGTLGGVDPHPVLKGLSAGERALVMLGIYPEIVRVLLWPVQLYADYSPAHVDVYRVYDPSQWTGIGLVAASIVGAALAAWRRPAIVLGLAIVATTYAPSSNLPFASGLLLAERTLYAPSIGVLLVLAILAAEVTRRVPRGVVLGTLGVVLVAGAVRSIDRARSWASSAVVFSTLVRDQPLSYKAHFAWGTVQFERGQFTEGVREFRQAIRIYPEYSALHTALAFRFTQIDRCDLALPYWQEAKRLTGGTAHAVSGVVVCLLRLARYSDAKAESEAALRRQLDPPWFRARLATIDSAMAAVDSVRK
jgi:tetratricopeptide (TPR) repeat protein